jgi:hypothetical protein
MDYQTLYTTLDLQGYEWPGDQAGKPFPPELLEQGTHLKKRLEEHFGRELRGGVCESQDSSHHGTLFLPIECEDNSMEATIVLSNFGHLATIDFEEKVPATVLNEVKTILEDLGYIYIPQAVALDRFIGVTMNQASFYERFFTWL